MSQTRKKFAPRQIAGGSEQHNDVGRNAFHSSARRGAGRRIGNRLSTCICHASMLPPGARTQQVTPGFNEHMGHLLPYAANCSLLFTEIGLLERPAAARAAGFDAIEFWWPWADQPMPPDAEIDKFIAAVRDAGVQLIGLNFFAGDVAGADCGALSIPARSAEFRDNIAVTMSIGEALGVPAFNALYGNRVDDVGPEQQDALAAENLLLAAQAAAAIDRTVLLEPISGPKPYPLRTADDVAAVLDRLPASNIGFLC